MPITSFYTRPEHPWISVPVRVPALVPGVPGDHCPTGICTPWITSPAPDSRSPRCLYSCSPRRGNFAESLESAADMILFSEFLQHLPPKNRTTPTKLRYRMMCEEFNIKILKFILSVKSIFTFLSGLISRKTRAFQAHTLHLP